MWKNLPWHCVIYFFCATVIKSVSALEWHTLWLKHGGLSIVTQLSHNTASVSMLLFNFEMNSLQNDWPKCMTSTMEIVRGFFLFIKMIISTLTPNRVVLLSITHVRFITCSILITPKT